MMHAYISKASSLDTLTPGMEIVTSSHLDIGGMPRIDTCPRKDTRDHSYAYILPISYVILNPEGPTTLIMPVRFPSLSARMWYLAERQPLLEAIDPLSSPASLSILYIQWDGQPGASRLLRFPIRRQVWYNIS